MTSYAVGVNLGFAVNRFPEPKDWVPVVAEDVGIKRVQFVADLLNPALPASFRAMKVKEINRLCSSYGIKIESAFTGAFTRVNHFGSEELELLEYWVGWFKDYIRQSSEMGATSFGGHLGILSLANDSDPNVRKVMLQRIVGVWHELDEFAQSKGMHKAAWEPMSISREFGHTLEDAREIQNMFKGPTSTMGLCLDLDHGDITSSNCADYDPVSWIAEFASELSMLHLKQTTKDRRKNMAFTEVNNLEGTVKAKEIIEALRRGNVAALTMYLELGFRERNPNDRLAVVENSESADYWLQAGATI
jgi:sugar phosphate isomerase/epimerase